MPNNSALCFRILRAVAAVSAVAAGIAAVARIVSAVTAVSAVVTGIAAVAAVIRSAVTGILIAGVGIRRAAVRIAVIFFIVVVIIIYANALEIILVSVGTLSFQNRPVAARPAARHAPDASRPVSIQ